MVKEDVRELKFADAGNFARAERNLRAQGYVRFEQFTTDDPEAPAGLRAYRDRGTPRLLGHLVWWSLPDAEFGVDVNKTLTAAIEADVPKWIVKSVKGMTGAVAFWRASQFGAKGIESPRHNGDPDKGRSYFLTKRVGTDTAIVRETLDRDGRRVSLTQCALMWIEDKSGQVKWEVANKLPEDQKPEVMALLNKVQTDTYANLGQVEVWATRELIRRFLISKFRICLRGTGGVYFVPGEDATDLVAIRNWVMSTPLEGSFSISEMWTGGANSTADLTTSAIAELTDALTELDADIADKINSAKPDRALSVKPQVKAAQELAAKLDALEAVLGEMAPVRAMLDAVSKRAVQAAADSRSAVDMAKAAKAQPQRKALAADPVDVPTIEAAPVARKNGRKALAPDPVAEQAEPVVA